MHDMERETRSLEKLKYNDVLLEESSLSATSGDLAYWEAIRAFIQFPDMDRPPI
jgi:hypothetical protein